MKQLRYNLASNVLRIEFPVEWDVTAISALTVGIKDKSGTALLAAQSVTLYTETSLAADTTQFQKELVLDAAADALAIGDSILVAGPSGQETHQVANYVAATKTVTIESILELQHDEDDEVYGLFGNYTLDTTDTDVFLLGMEVVVTWTPSGTGNVITEVMQISKSALDVAGLTTELKGQWPRVYSAFKSPVDKLPTMITIAERQIGNELLAERMDFQRIVNQDVAIDIVMAKLAWLWAMGADEDMEDERAVILNEYEKQFGIVTRLPIWTDDNQDEVEDEEEVTTHEHVFERGW